MSRISIFIRSVILPISFSTVFASSTIFASAEVADTNSDTVTYTILSQATHDFLKMLSRDSGVRIQAENGVRGRLDTVTLSGSVTEILDALSRSMDVEWFDFEGQFYVSRRSDGITRLTNLGDINFETAVDTIREAGLLIDRFPVTETAGGASIAVTGPARYVAFVESIIEAIPSPLPVVQPIEAQRLEEHIIVRRGMEIFYEAVE